MHAFDTIVERRIREAVDRGEFENLPGTGEALILDDDPFIPEDMRMAYRILKNAGYIPPEIELRRDISVLEQDLAGDMDDETRGRTLKKLQCLFLRLDESRRRQAGLLIQQDYYRKIINRMAGTDNGQSNSG